MVKKRSFRYHVLTFSATAAVTIALGIVSSILAEILMTAF